jgi:hypothetical protein
VIAGRLRPMSGTSSKAFIVKNATAGLIATRVCASLMRSTLADGTHALLVTTVGREAQIERSPSVLCATTCGFYQMPKVDTMDCPKCEEECWRESVDVGVGVIYGPFGCSNCGWSEDPYYDCSNGPPPAQVDEPSGRVVTQFGVSHSDERLQETMDEVGRRFGVSLNPKSQEALASLLNDTGADDDD